MADHMVGLFFGEKMRQKKVTCEYCAKELQVRASSKGPFYCGSACEQIRKATADVGETLSIDRNYVDVDDDPMWRELSITTAMSEEDRLRAEREVAIEAARKKNREAQRAAASAVEGKTTAIYKFSGEVYRYYEREEFVVKRDDCFIKKRLLRQALKSLLDS